MKTMLLVALALSALGAADPALDPDRRSPVAAAEDAARAAEAARAAAPAPPPELVLKIRGKEPLICKNETPVGSRLPAKVCLTAYDWQERRAASLRSMDQMTSKGNWP